MARITVEDCLEHEENRFALVILASQRAHQLIKGAEPLVQSKNKPTIIALREIAEGKVSFTQTSHKAVEEWIEKKNQLEPARA